MKKLQKTLLLASVLFLSPLFAFALEQNYPSIGGVTLTGGSFANLVKYFFNACIAIGGVLAFVVIVQSGIRLTTSEGEPAAMSEAKKKMKNAFLGLGVLLLSYILLTTINPNLVVIKDISLSATSSPSPSPGGGASNPTTKPTISFQEVPVGKKVEKVLARNISCFDKDRNLIDCDTKDIISEKPKDEYSMKNSVFYCYKYDSNGDKSGVLENWDRLDCLQKFTNAYKIKMGTLYSYVSQLQSLLSSCNCSACEIGYWEEAPFCPGGCVSHCHTCGSPRNEYQSCNGSDPYIIGNDPCSNNRGDIDIMREKIRQLINGGAPGDPVYMHYDWQMDPNESHPKYNTKFMTLAVFQQKIREFEGQLSGDLNELIAIKKTIRDSGAEMLTMSEVHALEASSTERAIVSGFSEDTAKYCREFNCTEPVKDGLCAKVELNAQGRVCKIPDGGQEQYFYDGDPATFYFNRNYNTKSDYPITPNQTCTVEPKKENGIPEGMIPIGETSDQSEDLILKINGALNSMFSQIENAAKVALNDSDSMFNLPEQCKCSNCKNKMVELESMCCASCGRLFAKYKCILAMCTTGEDISSSTRVCPYATYSSKMVAMGLAKDGAQAAAKRATDLINSENLQETDPNRTHLLDKLTISRNKFNRCVQGFSLPYKGDLAKTRVFGCQEGLDLIQIDKLTIQPDYLDPVLPDRWNCYPFNSDNLTAAQRETCFTNKDSPACQQSVYATMDNYYCCKSRI